MNETDFNKSRSLDDELAAEYEFDYTQAKPNRFASGDNRLKAIVLDGVARVFTTSESVNKALRALIKVVYRSRRKVKNTATDHL
jgi:hypothetical protein